MQKMSMTRNGSTPHLRLRSGSGDRIWPCEIFLQIYGFEDAFRDFFSDHVVGKVC